jgi:hypothetical protein
MRIAALALLVLAVPAQEPTRTGVAVERTVRRTTIDWLGKREEVQRKELVLIKGSNLAILDLTFGERLIIRTDQKKVYKVDPLAGEYSEFTFDGAAAIRKAALDDIRSAKARVPGTTDEKELDAILEGFDQFTADPKVELKVTGAQSEVLVNGDRVRASVQVNPQVKAPGWVEALAGIGAIHPAVAAKFRELGGLPMKGTLRYTVFLDRIVEQFEVTSAQASEVPDADFELPAGLTRVPLHGFERSPERKLTTPRQLRQNFKEDEPEKPKSEPEKKP